MAIDKAVDSTILDGYFSDIADAIREKDGTQNTYTPSQMPTAIENIPSGSGGLDWTVIGYSEEPSAIQDGFDYAKEIQNNWTPQANLQYKFQSNKMKFMPLVDTSIATNMASMFQYCYGLIIIPQLNTSNVTNMGYMFRSCYSLTSVPLLNTSKVTNMGYMFQECVALKDVPIFDAGKATTFNNIFEYCESLTDESLDNILQMCIGASSYNGTKTLSQLGIKKSYYPATRIQALPHYQNFINAGWTIGY